MKRKIKLFMTCTFVFCMLFSLNVFAKGNNELTPIEIDQILKDVEPVEVSAGVYLRDNGDVSIYDVDVSQFEVLSKPAGNSDDDGEIINNSYSLRSWDLSTSYTASFKAKYRVFSSESFTGYDTIYTTYSNVVCPSGSTWQGAIYIGWDEQATSTKYASSATTKTVKFSNLDEIKLYRIAFQKTDDKKQATGTMKVYLP
jgi:hypothetical protein